MKKMINPNTILVGDILKTFSWRGEPSVLVTTFSPELFDKTYAQVLNVDELIVKILDQLPGLSKWYYDNGTAVNLIIKDPLLAYQEAYQLLLENLNKDTGNRLERLTIETGAETPLSENFADFLADWSMGLDGLWDSDPQKSLRFECLVDLFTIYQNQKVVPETLRQYQNIAETTLRLVTNGSEQQMEQIKKVMDSVRNEGFMGEIRLIPPVHFNGDFGPNTIQVRDLALKMGFSIGGSI